MSISNLSAQAMSRSSMNLMPLAIEDLRAQAPAVFAASAHESMSRN